MSTDPVPYNGKGNSGGVDVGGGGGGCGREWINHPIQSTMDHCLAAYIKSLQEFAGCCYKEGSNVFIRCIQKVRADLGFSLVDAKRFVEEHIRDHYKPEELIGTRWERKAPHDPEKGAFNAYTVLYVTNTAHRSPAHPPQVVYKGDNGHVWSLPLSQWPGNLKPHKD